VLEGIEAMFRTIGDGPSAWESLLPAEVLRLPEELARVDALLDDLVFFAPFAPYFHPVLGRPSTPVECCLRLMFLKFRHRLGFESLCAEVSDSITWRRFCRIPLDGRVPHPTTLMKLTTRCGQDAVAGLNEALWAKAAGAKLLRTARVRGDTTVISANVAYPTDAGLLAKAAGKLVRTARRVQAAGGATGTKVTDRRRAAARRMRQIASTLRSRGKLSREESSRVIRRVTGELADLAEQAAAQAAAVVRNGRRAVPRALSGRVRGRLRRALDELAITIERTATLVAQARTRLAGQTPDGATRLVSLHDPDARPIRKGRIDRPVEFGYKAPVTDNDDGIILDYTVEYGAAPDGPQLAPAIERVTRRAGRVPRAVTADRGYGQPTYERDLHHLGVRTVAIPARARSQPPATRSSTTAASTSWSNGAPAAKDESATSNAATAGTAPAWTASKEPPSGAGTEYSPTTWSRSRPGNQPGPPTSSATRAVSLFQVEVARGPASRPPGSLAATVCAAAG
jgi:IS5 family transposase